MKTAKWCIFSIFLASSSSAQNVRSSWEFIRAGWLPIFGAFDSSNIIYIGRDSGAFYSSNRGKSWSAISEPAIEGCSTLGIIDGIAIAVSRSDSSDYSSSDMGRTWIRHPWAPLPSTLKSRPSVKRWYGVGKGWYENIERIPQPFPPDLVRYNYLRQDVAFGPLISVESIVHDFLIPQSFDAADSETYAYSGGRAKYVKGTERSTWKTYGGNLRYLSEASWMIYHQEQDVLVFPNTPLSEPIKTHLPYPLYEVFSKGNLIIASYRQFTSPFRDGAYVSQDKGLSWSELSFLENNYPPVAPPSFWILDSLHLYMYYHDTLYYSDQGVGLTIPLASVAVPRDAAPGVAVFGSVLTVSGGGEVEVLDLLGRRVVRTERSASGEPVKINLLPYPDGIYFVHSGKEITKILWQRE